MRILTGIICTSLFALLAGCATTAPPSNIERISPEELARILPQPVPNLTLDEIVQMSKAGTPAPDIIAKIKETNSRYDLTPSESLELSRKGVSAEVLDYIHQAHEQALREGFADEINKREQEKRLEQERLRREYQSRYQRYHDPFWYGGYGFGPPWGYRWGPSIHYYRGW
jgi:hypothetical protein